MVSLNIRNDIKQLINMAIPVIWDIRITLTTTQTIDANHADMARNALIVIPCC
jgi:hypothetical protein